MRVSGFTIIRNALRYGYPFEASIRSILPICDEFIVNVGDSDDGTIDAVRRLAAGSGGRIRIMERVWDMGLGKTVLSHETNRALEACRGDWAFYLQSDEVIHEADLPRLRRVMASTLRDPGVDALRFRWLHFYGSYHRYRIDRGWYQKQDRIVRPGGAVISVGDAYGFARRDGAPLRRRHTGCLLYHYGWVHDGEVMARRRDNARRIGYAGPRDGGGGETFDYGDLRRFPVYFGSHPAVMRGRIEAHEISRRDLAEIQRRYWWHPWRILGLRVKTVRREKVRLT